MDSKSIGLEQNEVKQITAHLNNLLANYHIYYQKTRGCHWNVKGRSFFTLHAKFEEMYTEALANIDEIAERILTLGKLSASTFTEYLQLSEIKEINTIGMDGNDMVKALLGDLAILIGMERELLMISDNAKDDGTNDIINRLMQYKEKNTWMLRSFLNED